MPKLPVISGRDLAKVLTKMGFIMKSQNGSHIILKRETDGLRLSVPDHKELDKGTLNGLIKDAGLSRTELMKLLK
jgi:predicted RNA binding protein YcfA (HicA-like mRNA interferase family)